VIPSGTSDPRPVDLVPFVTKHPDIPLDGVIVAGRIPNDEADTPKRLFTRFQHKLVRWFSPMQPGLPEVSPDPERALAAAYTPAHRRCFPPPERTPQHDLGSMAVASPYASYLEATGDGAFRWDLSSLAGFECHPGLVELGATVDFRLDATSGGLTPVRIETALGAETPGSVGWDDAQRMAMCSITSHASLVRHFNWLHLTGGPVFEAVTRNQLRADHPVRRLVWAHVFGTHGGNDLVTEILMSEGGEFDAVFSLTHRGKCDLFEATHGTFDLAAINPVLDLSRRGLAGGAVDSPAHDSWRGLYEVFLDHARRYLGVYYASDDDLANDQALGAWIDELDARLPHGVRSVLGPGTTFEGTASLLATIVYLATVEHEITGSGLWDYQLWSDTSPVRVYRDGRRLPVDVYQRLVNANFNLNVHRTMLLDDALPGLALDSKGAWAFQELQQDLLGFQAKLDATAPAPWRMEPRRLKANINA
jgi:arachidonate 15-lipoxygenase